MKKLYLVFSFALCTFIAQAQCIGTTQYPESTVNSINTGVVQTITDCNYAGEYSELANLVVGEDYQFASSLAGTFITLTDTSNNVLASGESPLILNDITVTSVRLHVHTSAACGTDNSCHLSSIQCLSCTPPPAPDNDDCSFILATTLVNGGAPVVFNGTTVGATASAAETAVFETAAVWEAVELTAECSDLKVEYCGTLPGNMDTALVVYTDCLTEYTIGEYDFTTCPDGNATINFYGLPPGVYYLPVIADYTLNNLGDYVMTVSSIDCPSSPDCATAPIFPEDGAVDQEPINPILFTWTAPTTGPTPTGYDFYGGLDPNDLTLFGSTEETQYEISVGDYNLTVYWQVVPKNGSAGAEGCPVWSFTSGAFDFLGYCLDAEFGQYPTAAFTPTTCDGVTPNIVSDNTWAGEYAVVNVTAGQTYRFSSSEPDLITISYDGVTPDAYGASSVTWTATADGAVRFYTHLNDDSCGGETVARQKSVLCGASLSVNEFDRIGIKVYPNPVKNILNLRGQTVIQQITVYNILGQEVVRTTPNAMNTQLDMSALTSGTYFVKVTANDTTATLKVVKQ